MNKTSQITIFHPLYSSSGSWVAGASPSSSWFRVQGWHQLWTRLPSITSTLTLTHTHSDWDSLDTLTHFWSTSLRIGTKPERLEKTQANIRRMCKYHIVSGPGLQESISFLIKVVMKLLYSLTLKDLQDILLNFQSKLQKKKSHSKIPCMWNT